ncbi:MAG: O-antigen ligase family protein [Deltaproteobacteria bacterium]|nr:MAG: O-antigen ligase family protein [Deltaproteobacteria bacterium]
MQGDTTEPGLATGPHDHRRRQAAAGPATGGFADYGGATGRTDMVERLQRWTGWMGGPLWMPIILLVEFAFIASMAVDPRLTVLAVGGIAAAVLVVEQPLLGVALLLGARLLSTGATVFFRIGHMGIGPFEPALLLCLGALAFHGVFHRVRFWRAWPWRNAFLALGGFITLTILWSQSRSETIGEIIPLALVLANTLVILTFTRTWRDFRLLLLAWIGTCVLIALIATFTDNSAFLSSTQSFQAAAGGGRETGLGQQPNWYAMNLMFIIPTCFGMALVERNRLLKLALVGAGAFIFFSMLQSGSRGGAYATLIGGGLVALANRHFRKWFLRLMVASVVVGGLIVASNLSGAAALGRIASNGITLNQSYRQWNWEVCWQLFQDTHGLGIGAGGYTIVLPRYNYYLSQSLYDYPHGIFWEFLAHYGVIGLALLAWLIVAIVRMAADIVASTRGTVAEVVAWTMPAAMLGYFAWSFMEFTLTEKPFWEFLSLYTALYFVARRAQAGEIDPIPEWTLRPRLLGMGGETGQRPAS